MAVKPSKKPKSGQDLRGEAISNYNSTTVKGKGDSKKQAVAKSIKNEGGLGGVKKKKK